MEAQHPAIGVSTSRWTAPTTLQELAEILKENRDVRLVHANTSYGIYKNEYLPSTFYADIRFIPELNENTKITEDYILLSASTTYSNFIEILSKYIEEENAKKKSKSDVTSLEALDYMARRTAGRIVRNAASIGGNTMLVLKHIPKGTGEPF